MSDYNYSGGDDDDYKKKKYNKEEEAANYKASDDPRFENGGFNRERKCTDLFCCILFIAFVCAMGYLTNYGLNNGNVTKLLAPLDGDDNFCGVTPGYKDYTHLYLTSLSGSNAKAVFANGVCVK